MPLRKGNQLSGRFEQLACRAERIDVAVAWARPCGAVEALVQSTAEIRIVVGISKSFTDPSTLKRLIDLENVRLRIVPDDESWHIFHPKYYCFHGKKTLCWIGSANLTAGGFGGNDELVHEFELECEEDRQWFNDLWDRFVDQDPRPIIRKYEQRYTPPSRIPRPAGPERAVGLPSLAKVHTWEDFIEGLRAYDRYYRSHQHRYKFDVLGETHSWLHTIRIGREVARRSDWTNLTPRECYILRGFTCKHDNEGDWALLGGLRGGAPYVFNNANTPRVEPIRARIQNQLQQVLNTDPEDVAAVAHGAMETIRAMRHVEGAHASIGHAAATRWLALARPEYLVSVNRESASRLGKASGFQQGSKALTSKELADVYSDFLTWLHDRPWFNEFNERQPDDPLERDIWNCRAALVDVFAYRAKPES